MLIAVFIFTASLAALMTVSARGLKTARESQTQITADYLAIEGVEAVRNLRDSTLISQDNFNAWEDLFDDNNCWSQYQNNGSSCNVVYSSSNVLMYPCSTCIVYFSEPDTRYRQFSGSPSGSYQPTEYTREINFTENPSNEREITVNVVVTWATGSVEYSENMFLWI